MKFSGALGKLSLMQYYVLYPSGVFRTRRFFPSLLCIFGLGVYQNLKCIFGYLNLLVGVFVRLGFIQLLENVQLLYSLRGLLLRLHSLQTSRQGVGSCRHCLYLILGYH